MTTLAAPPVEKSVASDRSPNIPAIRALIARDLRAVRRSKAVVISMLTVPISDRDLFTAKFLTCFIPAIAVSWIGFACFCVIANLVSL